MQDENIVAVVPSRARLPKAHDRIMELDYLQVKYAAIVARANSGEVVVLDDDISPNEGGLAGGTLGAAITAFGLVQLGALALPGIGPIIALGSGLLAGGLVGNLTGRLVASIIDFDYKDYQVRALAAQLQAGHPALVLHVDQAPAMLDRLRAELTPYRAELVELLEDAPFRASATRK